MEKQSLLKFIWQAHQRTYAAAEGEGKKNRVPTASLAGHVEYSYTSGDWRYQDLYSGFWSPPGKEVVFFQEKPVWTMAYQGQVFGDRSESLVREAFSFLKEALRSSVWEEPYRGLRNYSLSPFSYSFSYEGDYDYFIGKEIVRHQGETVFFQDVMGSVIF